MDLKRNEHINGTIIDINDDGQGVLKTLNQVCFVPHTLVGEEIEGTIIFDKSKYLVAKVTSIKNPNTNRVSPPCPYFYMCGGCDLQHMNKQLQIDFKTQKVENAFKRICKVSPRINTCISKNDSRYRNKIALPVGEDGSIGLYRKNTHSIVKVEDCLICESWNKDLILIVNQYINKYSVSCFNEKTNTGLLKHIVARKIDNSILITFVINGNELPHQSELVELFKQKFCNFGINININKQNNNVILTDKWKHLYGQKELTANEFGIVYPLSNASFYQVNNDIKNEIYKAVLSQIPSDFDCIDAYSGAGLLSAIISKKAKKCIGVEIVKEATENANELKKLNGLNNLEFINGDCTKVIPKLIKTLSNKVAISLDPPRKGCDPAVLEAIKKANPQKIIYISCNPQTLARDTKTLLENTNYKITLIQPYDMFPQTSHVETLLVLEKK